MHTIVFYLILAYIIIFIVRCFYKNFNKNLRSSKKTQQYIIEKVALENKYCNELPLRDSVGRASGYASSFSDKSGKFSPEFLEEMNQLNEKYDMPVNKKK